MCLDLCRAPTRQVYPAFQHVSTPLGLEAWKVALRTHPDRALARFLLTGIREGFRIGFDRRCPLKPASCNMLSAAEHPAVIQAYLDRERSLGRMLGPFRDADRQALPLCHVNRFGVIPKGHNTGKWRLITDLSYPPGQSVNDGISPELCSLSYSTVEQVAEVVARYKPGSLMGKIDIESAYRLVPVHPEDRPLQGMEWGGGLYVDPMLPFGLRSAPKLFNAIADAIEWYLRQRGVQNVFHYLDDFIVVGPPDSTECADAIRVMDQSCTFLGVPIAEHKRDGPTTCLTFLGIEIDTVASQLRLPSEKLHRLQSLLVEWGDRKACSRRELESLIGLLNHACKVVRSGRSFLRRMIDLLQGVPMHRLHPHPIRLNREFRSDLAWWHLFVQEWNGVSFLPPPPQLAVKEMASDASGSWGCGAWHETKWFQLQWDVTSQEMAITAKELLPIVVACALWGPSWTDRCIRCHCDNQAVVACLRSRTIKHSHCMHMLQALAFLEARHCFHLQPVYINTKLNHLADDLSRNNLFSFLSKVPCARRVPDQLPRSLMALLLDPDTDWTSPLWISQFSDIFKKVSLPIHEDLITQH